MGALNNVKYVLVGTAKGLIVLTKIYKDWKFTNSYFLGFPVTLVYVDHRNDRWWVGVSHKHWGQKLHYSDDQGKSWSNAKIPTLKGYTMPTGQPGKVRQLWCMAQGGADKPDRLWLGTDPGALFISENNGKNFSLVESLWNHPTKMIEGQWFGAGSDYPFIHSIVVDPSDNNIIYIAVSCAGIFKTIDGGKNWSAKNNGLIAAYLPNPNVEVGHDPHILLMPKANTNILWQQNHCGVFYSSNSAESWIDVSNHKGIPYYGFAMAIDDDNPNNAWVMPVESDDKRVAPDLKLNVYHTPDLGETWEVFGTGLPQSNTFDIALRQAFIKTGNDLIFGTTNGNIYHAEMAEKKWKLISYNLTKVNVISATD